MSYLVTYPGSRSAEAARREKSPLKPFRTRLFLALWIASLVSNIGTFMQGVSAAWYMTSLSSSALMVGLVQTATSLPIFLLALPAGALADIVDRRRLLLCGQWSMLAAATVLGLLALFRSVSPWTLLGLSFALGVGAALSGPAWQASIPELVPHEDLVNAIALNGIGFNLARAIGPTIAGVVVARSGVAVAFLCNAASFLGVILVLHLWRRQPRHAVLPAERVMGAIRAGLRYVRFAPGLAAVLTRAALFVAGPSVLWALLPQLAKTTGQGATGYGILLGFFGAGGAAGGLALPWFRQRLTREGVIITGTVVFGLALVGIAETESPLALWALMLAAGAAWVTTMAILNVSAQTAVPKWIQGRALSMYLMVVQGGMAGGGALWGGVAEHFDLRFAFLCAGVTALAGLLLTRRFPLPTMESFQLEPAKDSTMPSVVLEPDPDSGPVMVSIEYLVEPERSQEFAAVMQAVSHVRKRDGAIFWGLFADVAQPGRYVEYFIVESWIEHLRQHERLTVADSNILRQARSFHKGDALPVVRHEVAVLKG